MLGYFVMAINVSNECDKLNPRGMPCVFLGYPQTKKRLRALRFDNKQAIYFKKCEIL